MAETQIHPAAEFQALPLEFIVAAPLIAAVKAQTAAAEATKGFILSLMDKEHKPINIEFNVSSMDGDKETPPKTDMKNVTIKAPLLSMVHIPHLRIESVTNHFKYEITQTVKDAKSKDLSIEMETKSGAALSPWVNAGLKGSVSSRSSQESLMNSSGVLEITVQAGEGDMPDGLKKILGFLARSIQVTPAGTQAE